MAQFWCPPACSRRQLNGKHIVCCPRNGTASRAKRLASPDTGQDRWTRCRAARVCPCNPACGDAGQDSFF
ncbi:hypothetical protein BN2497_11105 [Janthinobacterium sp. CG23_2]|nr:hypothetical protein BN2497_11105 [Janthinobacterium sp. CG23_2]CUU31950.1 hypothetical protein BN3177_11105 [Janthinobacterium sp. CG23_2]